MIITGHSERLAALREHARSRRDGKDGKTEIVVKQDDEAVKALKERIAILEAEAKEPANDSDPIPRAIGEIVSELDAVRKEIATNLADIYRRIQALETKPTEIVAAEPAELQDSIDVLNEKIADFAKSILTDLLEHEDRLTTVETRVNNMPKRLREFYEIELKSSA